MKIVQEIKQEIKFWIRIIKTALHVKGYEWYSPYVRRAMEEDNEKPKYKLGERIVLPAQITKITITSQDELEYGVELFDDVLDESEIDEYNSKLNNPDDSLFTEDSEACKEQESKLDLISREQAIEAVEKLYDWLSELEWEIVMDSIKNLPPVEPKIYGNEHNCIMTMFGECSYSETGCGSCAVVQKVRNALKDECPQAEPERPKGEWIVYSLVDEGRVELECPECGDTFVRAVDYRPHFCENCGCRLI